MIHQLKIVSLVFPINQSNTTFAFFHIADRQPDSIQSTLSCQLFGVHGNFKPPKHLL